MSKVFTDELIAVFCPPVSHPSSSPDGELLAKQFAASLNDIGPAIALAGAAYVVVLAIGSPIVFIALALIRIVPFDLDEIARGLAMMFVYGFLGAFICLTWAIIVEFVTLPLVYTFVRSLQLRGSIIRLGAFCGGLVGFVAILPLSIGAMIEGPGTLTEIAPFVLLGPALATVVGQLGRAWGGWRARWYERALWQAAIRQGCGREELPANSTVKKGTLPHHRVRFGMRHLLVISVWISLLLTAIRLSGLDCLFMLLLMGGWFVFQLATLWVGGRVLGWIGRRTVRRQSCST